MRSSPSILPLLIVTTLLYSILLPPIAFATDDKTSTAVAADLVLDHQLIDLKSEKYINLFKELREQHQFGQDELDKIFHGVSIKRRVLELMDKQSAGKSFYSYLALFFTPAIVEAGKQKLAEHKELFDRIERELGVDREYIVAIWAIETRFGQNQGSYPVFQALNTLFDAYPRRSVFFRKQLIHFLLLCRENNMEPKNVMGSYAGAFGQTQFIPSSFREYAVSFDGDERRDVFHSVPDILASIGNYLRRHHWVLDAPIYADIGKKLKSDVLINANKQGHKGLVPWRSITQIQRVVIPRPPADKPLSIISVAVSPLLGGGQRYIAGYPNFHAITAWNHSTKYAMAVSHLAQAMAR